MNILLNLSTCRLPRFGACFVWGVFLVLAGSINAEEASLGKVEALHKERISVLETLVKLRRSEYSEGVSTYEVILKAMNQLADAKYDAAKTPAERLAIRKDAVDRWGAYMNLVMAKFEAATVTKAEVLQAKAGFIKAKLLAAQELEKKK